MEQIDVHYIQIKVCRLSGDGQTPTLPQTLKEVTYVFADAKEFSHFVNGFEFFFLEKFSKAKYANLDSLPRKDS